MDVFGTDGCVCFFTLCLSDTCLHRLLEELLPWIQTISEREKEREIERERERKRERMRENERKRERDREK